MFFHFFSVTWRFGLVFLNLNPKFWYVFHVNTQKNCLKSLNPPNLKSLQFIQMCVKLSLISIVLSSSDKNELIMIQWNLIYS